MPLFEHADGDVGQRLLLAASLGALVGVEHERSAHARGSDPEALRFGGVRTYALFGLAGALAAWLGRDVGSPWVLATGTAGLLLLLALAPQRFGVRESLTTEASALVVFLLGAATALGHEWVALQAGIGVTALLALRGPLHRLASSLAPDDVQAGLQLLVGAFVVLPLLPSHPIDPWGVVVPREAALLVLLISGLSLAGYVASRWLGSTRGLLGAGAAGGMVSSTAVTLAMARQSKTRPEAATALGAGVVAAWAVMVPRVLVEVAVVAPALVPRLLGPLGGLLVGLAGHTWWTMRRRAAEPSPDLVMTNPFSIPEAARFTLVFLLIRALVEGAERFAGPEAIYAVSALAGATDVDAITLSVAGSGGVAQVAATAIVIAVASNTWIKVLLAWVAGDGAFARSLTRTAAVGTALGALGWGVTALW